MSIVTVKNFGIALGVSGGTIRSKISRGQLLRNKKGFIDTEHPTNYIYILEVNGGNQECFEQFHIGNVSTSKVNKKSITANKTSHNIEKTLKPPKIVEKQENKNPSDTVASVNIAPSQNKTRKCKECGDYFVNTVSHRSLTYCGVECQKKVRAKVNLSSKQKRKDRIDSGDVDFIANEVFGKYKQKSPSRGLEFDLTLDFFKKHVHADCYYCGCTIPKVGFDRKDNSIGYIEENCVPCCPECNFMKRDLSFDDFIEQCQLIAENFKIEEVVKKVKNSDTEKLTLEEKRELSAHKKHNELLLSFDLRKKEAEVLLKEREGELKQWELEKKAGNTLPLNMVERLVSVNYKAIFKSIHSQTKNIAMVMVQQLGGSKEDLDRIMIELEDILDMTVKDSEKKSAVDIEKLIDEYSEIRSRGERKV